MNVTVIGSFRRNDGSPWPLRNEAQFSTFCETLGRRLAESNHFLIVPCDNDKRSADWACLKGFRSVAPDPRRWAVLAPGGRTSGGLPKGHIDAARRAQCVIIIGGANGTYAAGMTAVYRRTLIIPIGCFGGAAESLLDTLELKDDHLLKSALFTGSNINIARAVGAIMKELNGHPRLLIVHGRSVDRDSVKKVLEEKANVHRSVILDYSGNAAISLSSKFSSLAGTCTGAIIIATPDDIGASVLDGKGNVVEPAELLKFRPRARENVWIEMGWLWSNLGRDRILLLVKKGDTTIPSDVQDAVRFVYEETPLEVEDRILAFVSQMQQGERVIDQ